MAINNNSFSKLTQQEFTTKDRNRDGVLSAGEYGDKQEFAKYDKNHDGELTSDELTLGRNAFRMESDAKFKKADKNKDGFLSTRELETMLKGLGMTSEDAKGVFEQIDANGDHKISKDEHALARQAGHARVQIDAAPAPAQNSGHSLSSIVTYFEQHLEPLKRDMIYRKEGLNKLVSEVSNAIIDSNASSADKQMALQRMIKALPTNNWDYDAPRERLRSLCRSLEGGSGGGHRISASF